MSYRRTELAGYYAEQIARAGCVGILAGVTMPLVHPLGGLERLLGTNPLAIAVGKPLGEAVRTGYYDKGELIIAMDPEAFGDPAIFRAAVETHVAELREVTPIPGSPAVRIPGERSFSERQRRQRDGIPVDPQVWGELLALANE